MDDVLVVGQKNVKRAYHDLFLQRMVIFIFYFRAAHGMNVDYITTFLSRILRNADNNVTVNCLLLKKTMKRSGQMAELAMNVPAGSEGEETLIWTFGGEVTIGDSLF